MRQGLSRLLQCLHHWMGEEEEVTGGRGGGEEGGWERDREVNMSMPSKKAA